jgi:hypothetical protein
MKNGIVLILFPDPEISIFIPEYVVNFELVEKIGFDQSQSLSIDLKMDIDQIEFGQFANFLRRNLFVLLSKYCFPFIFVVKENRIIKIKAIQL